MAQHGRRALLDNCLQSTLRLQQYCQCQEPRLLFLHSHIGPGSCRFLQALADTSGYLKADWKEFEFLHIKLGPDWQQAEAQQLLDNVMEIPPNAGWERPPGLGTCALETIFYLCHLIHNWLRSSEEHAVVRLACCNAHREEQISSAMQTLHCKRAYNYLPEKQSGKQCWSDIHIALLSATVSFYRFAAAFTGAMFNALLTPACNFAGAACTWLLWCQLALCIPGGGLLLDVQLRV